MSLEQLFLRLSQSSRDQIISVMNQATSDDSKGRLEKIDAEIDSLRRELDDQFRKRESLKASLASIDSLIDSVAKEQASDDIEVSGLHLWLKSRSQDLKEQIAALHPEEKLRKKLKLVTERDLLDARRGFCQTMASRILQPARAAERSTAKKGAG